MERYRTARPASPWAANEGIVGLMGGTVLVGEDDQGVQAVLSELLTSAGYEVVLAGDGRELKRCVEEGLRPSVILLDLTMPGADGYDFRIVSMTSSTPNSAATLLM
jgi:CheY-like chemotaxis protein